MHKKKAGVHVQTPVLLIILLFRSKERYRSSGTVVGTVAGAVDTIAVVVGTVVG